MNGHWEYDDEWFYTKDEMWEFIRDNDYLDDIDFERWINFVYTPMRLYTLIGDALGGKDDIERIWYDIYDEFLDDYYGNENPIDGEDFEFCDLVFKWVDEREEEE